MQPPADTDTSKRTSASIADHPQSHIVKFTHVLMGLAAVAFTFACLTLILPWYQGHVDIPVFPTGIMRSGIDGWQFGNIACSYMLNVPASAITCTKRSIAAMPAGDEKDASIVATFFSVTNAMFCLGVLVYWLRTFRKMGGIDLCGSKTADSYTAPGENDLVRVFLVHAVIAFWAFIAFAVYAGLLTKPLDKSGLTYSYSAGFAFEILLMMLSIGQMALTWVYFVRLTGTAIRGPKIVASLSSFNSGQAGARSPVLSSTSNGPSRGAVLRAPPVGAPPQGITTYPPTAAPIVIANPTYGGGVPVNTAVLTV